MCSGDHFIDTNEFIVPRGPSKPDLVAQTGDPAHIFSIRIAGTLISVDEEALMIVKVREGYQVLSSKGRNLGGPYRTLEEAKRRLRQVEFFKRRKG